MSRLVLDAPIAVARPEFAASAGSAGISVTVDPMTFLVQSAVDPDGSWAKLPFARAEALTPAAFESPADRKRFVSKVMDFQVNQGATVLVAPYFYAKSVDDPWFHIGLDCLKDAALYLRTVRVRLPLTTVIAGRLDGFAPSDKWSRGLDLFADTTLEVGAQSVCTLLGPAGKTMDNYDKVRLLFQAALRLRRPGLNVHAWRQGVYGPALVAAGVQGYESGIGVGESTDLAYLARAKKSKPETVRPEEEPGKKKGGRVTMIYLPALGRSIPLSVARTLSENLQTRASFVCDEPVSCCPNGFDSTFKHHREHAVRSRARYLGVLDQMPPKPAWRLHKIAQDTRTALTALQLANNVLVSAGQSPMNTLGHESLASAVDYVRGQISAVA